MCTLYIQYIYYAFAISSTYNTHSQSYAHATLHSTSSYPSSVPSAHREINTRSSMSTVRALLLVVNACEKCHATDTMGACVCGYFIMGLYYYVYLSCTSCVQVLKVHATHTHTHTHSPQHTPCIVCETSLFACFHNPGDPHVHHGTQRQQDLSCLKGEGRVE